MLPGRAAAKRLVRGAGLALLSVVYAIARAMAEPKRARIVFSSSPNFGESPRAVFDFLLQRAAQPVELVWLANRRASFTQPAAQTGSPARVRIVSENTPLAVWLFATAGYVFYSHAIYEFTRPRDGQTIVNLWHGMPIKRIGLLDWKDREHIHFATHSVATSDYYRTVVAQSFGLSEENVLLTGLPRNDELLRPARGELTQLIGEWRRLVVWMPTFRKSDRGNVRTDGAELLTPELLTQIDAQLDAVPGVRLIVKLHRMDHLVRRAWPAYRNIAILREADLARAGLSLYRMVATADALVTDYSSVAVDALGHGIPVGLFHSEDEAYVRGFNPGAIERLVRATHAIEDIDALVTFIVAGAGEPAPDGDARAQLHSVPPGQATAALLRLLAIPVIPEGERTRLNRHSSHP